jgi:starch phosphorylase
MTEIAEKPVSTARETDTNALAGVLEQYGCGPAHFDDAHGLYQRHLTFDHIKDPAATGPREHFEAAARSVRDILSQRWVATERTYERENPKRIYYLSMELGFGKPSPARCNGMAASDQLAGTES